MIISGTGISSTPVKIIRDFVPETKYSMKWTKLSSGNYTCIDRGSVNDAYEVEIEFYSTETTINSIINLFEENREYTSGSPYTLILSSFSSTEHIFGADLDYTGSITVSVLSVTQRKQNTLKGFKLTTRIAAVSPVFVVGSGSLPLLRIMDTGIQADASYTINTFSSLRKVYFHVDNASDIGSFTGTFNFSDSEMQQLRRYIATQRISTISIPNIFGVTKPFGRLSSSYPYNVKIIDFKDLGMYSSTRWKCSLTFAQVL